MNSIPVLGSLVMTGPEWIKRQIESIDYPVDNYVLFNNGGSNEVVKYIDDLFKEDHPFIKNKQICHLPSNLGVQAGWNLIIKSYMLAPYWIITSHDVSFTDGILEEMHEAAKDIEVGMVYPNAGDFGWGSYDLFLIKDWVVQSVGLFDESFYPAYFEDFDYAIRLHNKSIKTITGLNHSYYHGDTTDYIESGSQTAKTSPLLAEKFNRSKEMNLSYLQAKWGANYMTEDGEEYTKIAPYSSPYNLFQIDEKMDKKKAQLKKLCADNYHLLGSSSFNLEFARSKHLGEF